MRDHLAFFRIDLAVWEKRVLYDLDNAVVPILNRPKGKAADGLKTISVKDAAGIGASLRSLGKGRS